jgi:HSP20 family protein
MATTEESSKVSVKQKPEAARAPWKSGWPALEALRHEVDRVFDDFRPRRHALPFKHRLFDFEPFRRLEMAADASVPVTDVKETAKAYKISVELPGVEPKDVEVTVAENMLRIRGEKKEERETEEQGYSISERSYGAFERSLILPEGIEEDKISAKVSKGVLTVVLPKPPEAQKEKKQKKINVSSD